MENKSLQDLYASREQSLALTRPLRAEDCRQSMQDMSPRPWYLSDRVLEARTDYRLEHPHLEHGLNWCCESLEPRPPRDELGQAPR